MNRPIRVAIADDHPLVRAGIKQVIADDETLTVVGEAADGDATVTMVRSTLPDVLVLDLSMPGAPFPGLLRVLRTAFPALRVLVVTMHTEEQFAARALREGVAGYVTKDRPPDDIIAAVKQVAAGGRYITAALADSVADASNAELPHERASQREYEVLCLIGCGKTVKQIAIELGLSPKTVSTHRARLLRKMRFTSSAELIRYAVQHGLSS
jgi:two-component system, NarL family, invasion response regulator UvrY